MPGAAVTGSGARRRPFPPGGGEGSTENGRVAVTYLTEHSVAQRVDFAVRAMCAARPARPLPFLADYLRNGRTDAPSSLRDRRAAVAYVAEHGIASAIDTAVAALAAARPSSPLSWLADKILQYESEQSAAAAHPHDSQLTVGDSSSRVATDARLTRSPPPSDGARERALQDALAAAEARAEELEAHCASLRQQLAASEARCSEFAVMLERPQAPPDGAPPSALWQRVQDLEAALRDSAERERARATDMTAQPAAAAARDELADRCAQLERVSQALALAAASADEEVVRLRREGGHTDPCASDSEIADSLSSPPQPPAPPPTSPA
eukprot:TRINITY_DN4036_c0_g1_i2.p1 TRINITY_DN4036_c0_g1~~TRINITY_DN4036_c0_g1_i2.p1  ORF type:complete len:363 (+),score=70.13 TRINITY_DN4036_c0_g1_i2:116-1090(+)